MSDPTRKEVLYWLDTGDGPDEGKPGWTARLGEAYIRAKKLVTTLRALRRKDRKAMLGAIEQLEAVTSREAGRSIALRLLRARLEES